eukprot:TRINITY_DN25068_c0_g1_i1.p1 TRINITY_DN25068_c0_g1~~TRINITY_DN25068_c0_g1_i1.p1  ORF type:complete len:301 (-),score=26.15 TRINITY_DN25068_c0_g1_i1:78-980(-)
MGWADGGIWFAVCAAQLIKDALITRARGLSVIQSWMNLAASVINCFFIFTLEVPAFSLVTAVYMPVLNAMVVLQLLVYRRNDWMPLHWPSRTPYEQPHHDIILRGFGWTLAAGLCASVACIAALSYWHFLPASVLSDGLSWVAIGLWSIECYWQIHLNMRAQSCKGQSFWGLGLVLVGKAADFQVQYCLQYPGRYLLLAFCSSASGLLNIMQALWWHATPRVFGRGFVIVVLLPFVFGWMPYVVAFEIFPQVDSTNVVDRWFRSSETRAYALVLPVLAVLPVLWGLLRHSRRDERYPGLQ